MKAIRTSALVLASSLALSIPSKGGIFLSVEKLKPKEKEETSQKVNLTLPKNANREKKVDVSKFELTGIVSGIKAFAIINGKVLGVGDKIDKCFVKKIFPKKEEVVLNCENLDVRITLNSKRDRK